MNRIQLPVDPRLETILHDLRFTARQLRKNPGFACTAILVLALGIAASVSIFAFVDAALVQPLPYKNPSRLLAVYENSSTCPKCELSYQDYLDWKKDNTVFSSLEAWTATAYLWRSSRGVQDLRAARVSGGFFRTLGVEPVLGRGFSDYDDTPAAPRTVLLTYAAWQSRFGGRPDIVGQNLVLDDSSYAVIGVLPRDFHFPMRAAEFWTTIHDPQPCERTRGCHDVYAVARLKNGSSLQAALANVQALAAQLEKEYPESNNGQGAMLIPLSEAFIGDIRPILLLLLAGAGLLFVIACVNVTSLLLVRAEDRRREMVVRGALGASTGRLLQQFVTEGLVLVFFALAVGITLAYWVIPLLLGLIPERVMRGMPYFQGIGLHPRVLLFAGAISLLSIAIFTVTPALRLSVSNLREGLAQGGRASSAITWKRFGANLVAVELAVAMILLASAGLLGKSLYRLLHMDLNFNPEHVATLEMDASATSYSTDEQRIALSRRLIERISALPGVISAGHADNLPITCNCGGTDIRIVGHPWYGEHNRVLNRQISTDYFQVLQANRIRGRFFTETDGPSHPAVAIVNQSLARKFFGDEDPVGRMIGDASLSPSSLRRVIGVVDDIREGGLDDQIEPAMYSPFYQDTGSDFFIAVRTAQNPESMLPAIAAAIHRADPEVGVRNEFTLSQHISNSMAAFLHRSSAWLVGGFAGSALLLGIIGLYGVIAYSVRQRTREIGVRMALGAQRGAVYRLILGEAGFVTAAGIVTGLACSVAAAVLMKKLLFGVQAWDISTLAGVATVLGVCALAASYLPARRAASVNPVEALRAE